MNAPSPEKTIPLLPLLLQHGKTMELPITIIGCKKIMLHDLVYKNKNSKDFIKDCIVSVNGEAIRFTKSADNDKTYFINGEGSNYIIDLGEQHDPKFSLEVTCGDFDACGCKDHRFQLSLSAVYN